jgi:chaperonin cofactor prefoldin
MTTEPYDQSIRDAVAREAARRKRVLLAFLGFLIVPIAIGAYALSRAPKEVERVASEVTPLVADRVGGEISTKVTNDVVQRSESVIKENVSRETKALRSDIAKLKDTTQKQEQSMEDLQTRLMPPPPDNSRLLEEIQAMRAQIENNSALLKRLDFRVSKLEAAKTYPVPR